MQELVASTHRLLSNLIVERYRDNLELTARRMLETASRIPVHEETAVL